MTRADIVDAARQSIARGSKSFAAASHLFAPDTRERAWLLYSWCRACDDMADGQDHGHGMRAVDDPMARLARLTELSEAALAGQQTGDPPFEALRLVVAETGLPAVFVRHHLAGFALDAEGWRPQTEDDLLTYCYHVAGVVGCMMAVVMGVAPDDAATLDRACDLGLAFQLSNIARDIDEDAGAGRCYLPRAWLAEAGVVPDRLMAAEHRPALVAMVRRLTDRAAAFEQAARHGTPALAWRSAWAVLAAASIYGGIGRRVAALGGHAWDQRVTTSAAEKLAAVARAGWQAARRQALYGAPVAPSAAGWQRPAAG
ncbi:phytoene/squalene synthase family protein [Sphingomonas sp.]|uniref:phytoene/squalene synthase family protein n=1 Tax=Sphingomonas sp. TaxID=28214 RepID=UPI001E184901|nr:phytoene/squalene synthase family protein [Sphingomonas sp.]MBX9796291.1 phytoene/squalene synthase family protein [Sphingomonas sp.]